VSTRTARSSLAEALPDYDENCELCLAHKLTPWLYEDDECWIAECMICDTPMIVWRPHGLPEKGTEDRLMAKLADVATKHYEGDDWWADGHRRNIPDHWHCHARPKGGFFGR
jgi:hypothetical protein